MLSITEKGIMAFEAYVNSLKNYIEPKYVITSYSIHYTKLYDAQPMATCFILPSLHLTRGIRQRT